ncbi:LOW QUALITY PROTEIN: hypothetical protein U9M48_019142, partial [Paspalum notatum var. saurae]
INPTLESQSYHRRFALRRCHRRTEHSLSARRTPAHRSLGPQPPLTPPPNRFVPGAAARPRPAARPSHQFVTRSTAGPRPAAPPSPRAYPPSRHRRPSQTVLLLLVGERCEGHPAGFLLYTATDGSGVLNAGKRIIFNGCRSFLLCHKAAHQAVTGDAAGSEAKPELDNFMTKEASSAMKELPPRPALRPLSATALLSPCRRASHTWTSLDEERHELTTFCGVERLAGEARDMEQLVGEATWRLAMNSQPSVALQERLAGEARAMEQLAGEAKDMEACRKRRGCGTRGTTSEA